MKINLLELVCHIDKSKRLRNFVLLLRKKKQFFLKGQLKLLDHPLYIVILKKKFSSFVIYQTEYLHT